ncbi:InlB B-repeat-containing protein [Adhaeribacter pallidiroseus]|uniref:Pectate lyase n=1 Tax=Adhaeribacter pallidiroseus TaxID=2072847 RepID=A0A369QIZ1_9BACT|nr:T9SS type A sorting domain-containing protein [Adhaeribacter pallidiroseus]RDC62258.1 Pectate lyase [Adhaeribacter pallidiroseus]
MNTFTNPLTVFRTKYSCKHILLVLATLVFFKAPALHAQVAIKWDAAFGGSGNDVMQCQQQTSDGGYILGGTSTSPASGDKSHNSKGKEDFWIVKVDATGKKQWDKTFGGSGKDFFQTVQQTLDGGYILGGYSNSPVSGDKSDVASFEYDYWVIKIDAAGNKQWDNTFGGKRNDFLISVYPTNDKGYILGGSSNSPVSGKLGLNKSKGSKKDTDYWIIKLNSRGQKEWDRTISGSSFDYLRVIKQTQDKGFIIGGYSYSPSSGNKTGANKGFGDYWIVKVNKLGLIEWNKTIGGRNEDILETLEITKDGGYVLGGTSSSSAGGNKSQNTKGETDYWLVKMDNTGKIIWDKTLGGSRKDNLRSVKQTSDGGYIVGGYSTSPVSGDKSEKSSKDIDFWVIKLDASGSLKWDKTIGGNQEDGLQAVQQIGKGQYILGGYSLSSTSEDRTVSSKGNYDYWLVNILVAEESASNNAGTYALTLKVDGKGSINRSIKKDAYISGSVVSLTAKPAAGYKFTGWSGAVNVLQNPLTITINGNKNITAIFDPIGHNVYEAEEAFLKGAVISSEHMDYSGKGYADVKSKSYSIIRWVITDQQAGNCEISFRYSNGSGNSYPIKVILNDEVIDDSKPFKATETWSTWSIVRINANLKAGVNEIRLKSGEKGGPNVDYLRINNLSTLAETEVATSNSMVLNPVEQETSDTEQVTRLSAYPNPVPNATTLTFTFDQEEEYELSIYDLDGTVIHSFPTKVAKANEEVQILWDAATVQSGIYVAKLKTKSGVQTLRIIKK